MFSRSSKEFDPFEEFFESDSARYPTPMPSFNVEEYIIKITESDYDMHDSNIKNVVEDGIEYIIKQNLDTTTSVNLPIATEDMYLKYPKDYYVSQTPKLAALYHPQQQQQQLELPLSSLPTPPAAAALPPSTLFRFPMEYSAKFGGLGVADGQFTEPSGLVVTTEGDIVVADTNNHRIQIFDSQCNFKFAFGEPGKRDGQLLYPNRRSIEGFDPFEEFFESDSARYPTPIPSFIFNYNGEYLRSFGGEGITNYPISVSFDHHGQILVADNHNKFNLTVFDKDGNLVMAFESKVRHSHCFDAAIFDGVVVVASKDYKVYYYNYKMWGGRQPSISGSPPPMPLQSLLRPPSGFPPPVESLVAATVTAASSMSYL
uniref:Uncharacterized protein n=1 Tax=Panagrolaimus davidi TaxID=227884 RepID=A0A914QBU0_9BILA